jgi:hypothetical protein
MTISALGGVLAAFFIWLKWDRPWEALGVGVAVALAYWVLG